MDRQRRKEVHMPGRPAIELAPGVHRIPTAPFDLVNVFALLDEDGQVTLVDCGGKRASKSIVAGLADLGIAPVDVTRIVLTHAHSDHAGGLADMRARTGAPVAAHHSDAAYLRNGRAPVRDHSATGGRLVGRLPGGGFPPVEVSDELADGDVLDVGGGLRVVHTPGHTPGHVALLHEPSRVLITGDSIWNVRGRMAWPLAALCTDYRMNQKTAHVLGELDYDVAAFSHGPEIRDNAREAVRGFLRDEAAAS